MTGPAAASAGTALGDAVLLVAGVALVLGALDSAVRTFVLPRSAVQPVTRVVSVVLRRLFGVFAREARSYDQRDRAMALYGPAVLLTLPVVWLSMVMGGYLLFFQVVEGGSWRAALDVSGSALLTLGFARPAGTVGVLLAFSEAAFGLALVALLIAYLPTIYGAFARREVLVARLAARTGTPMSGVRILVRAQQMEQLHLLDDVFADWQIWFAEVEESHTSLGVLSFFRSPTPNRSWITAAGALLDAASLRQAALDAQFSPNAGLCILGGFTALRAVAALFGIPFDPDPSPTDPICVAREEFDEACEQLAAAGIPVVADRDRAWAAFQGWRVNYDAVLLGLAGLVMAPYAPWSSDRSSLAVARSRWRGLSVAARLSRGRPRSRRSRPARRGA